MKVKQSANRKWKVNGGRGRQHMRGEEKCTQVLMEEWKEINDWAVLNADKGKVIPLQVRCGPEGG